MRLTHIKAPASGLPKSSAWNRDLVSKHCVDQQILEQSSALDHLPAQRTADEQESGTAGGRQSVDDVKIASNLRQMPSLVGREPDRLVVRELLGDEQHSIVTVAGIGGIGKTRLAIAVGLDLVDETPGGVFLVRFAGIRDPSSILPMIADAVGVTGDTEELLARSLARRLGDRRAILILDNFEQLVAASSIVARLAASAEHLRVLVASQIPMRIAAERVFALGPLSNDEAAELFVERARARFAEFSPRRGRVGGDS